MNLDSLEWKYNPSECTSGRYRNVAVFTSTQTLIKKIVSSTCEDDDFGNYPWVETGRYYQDESGNKVDSFGNKI